MLGEQIAEETGKVMVRRVISVDGGPRIEVTVQGTGKLLGIETRNTVTYSAGVRPDGSLYGEARPGRSSTSGCAARWLLALFVVLGSTSLMGAARADETPAASDIEDGASNDYDPWQHFNEKMFFFNHDVFDRHLLKPIAKGWNKALPDVGKRALDRAFDNLGMPRRLVNNLLQGRFRGAGREVARFGVNTTIGVVGFLDVAKAQLHIDSSDADTGQTLGVYGWGPGPYLVLPSLQPLTVRDGIGYGVDGLLDPVGYVTPFLATTGMSVVKQVNKRSLNLELFQDVEDSALDLYSAVRNGYLQRRHGSIEQAIEARHTERHPPPVKETAAR